MLKLTRKDICAALEVPEHRMRAWMRHLPFRSRATTIRKARVFDTTDLILLAIAQILEDQFKLQGEGLDNVLPALNQFLRRPQHNARSELLFINIRDWSIEYASLNTCQEPGLVIDILPAQERVARFLGLAPAQEELALGPLPLKRLKG